MFGTEFLQFQHIIVTLNSKHRISGDIINSLQNVPHQLKKNRSPGAYCFVRHWEWGIKSFFSRYKNPFSGVVIRISVLKEVRNFTGPCPGPNREKCTVLSSLYSVVAATLSFSQKFSDSMLCLLWRIKCWGGRRDTQSLFSPLTDDVEVGPPGRSASLSSLRFLGATATRPRWWERKNLR